MKIMFFDFTINFGGAPQGSLYLMKRLQNAGVDVKIVDAYGSCNQYAAKAQEYNLPYTVLMSNTKKTYIGHSNNSIKRFFSIFMQLGSFLILFLQLLGVVIKDRPDFVLVNNEKSLVFARFATFFTKTKLVLYFRGEGIESQLSKRFIWLLSKATTHVVAHSKKAVSNIINAGVSSSKVSFIPNCIELSKFDQPILNTDLPSKPKIRILLAAARPVREKGHHVAIEALNQLVQSGFDVDLIFPGIAPVGIDDAYTQLIKKMIIDYQLESRVHFIGWRNNLLGDIAQSDIIILPSHTEGFPRVVIESMVQGIPVCATPVGGIPEAIQHRNTGMIFAVDNASELKSCLVSLIEDDDLRLSIIKNAKSFSREFFHPAENTNAIMKVFNELKEG